jgi:hypothetical protein
MDINMIRAIIPRKSRYLPRERNFDLRGKGMG